jgi:hypothetical protein
MPEGENNNQKWILKEFPKKFVKIIENSDNTALNLALFPELVEAANILVLLSPNKNKNQFNKHYQP